MKYNRSEIMRTAHRKYSSFTLTFAQALHMAWAEARMKAARYNVYGERFGMDGMVLIVGNVDMKHAAEIEEMNKCRYDRISILERRFAG